uniref:H(+)-transporting two-sector ATPase n=1 Tax=Solanum lycopersicum TaxID=4081 RepID=A0A3Q7JAW1_SOLLC
MGCAVQIIGPVLDVAFPLGKIPNTYNALVVQGQDSVDGLTGGRTMIDIEAPISVSVGGATLGQTFNVLREPVGGVSIFGGVGERSHKANDLFMQMKESGVINKENIPESKVALV